MNWWQRRADSHPAIAPSLLAADFADLRDEISSMQAAGVDLFHLDVMDGHFVPNLTFGPFIAAAIRRCTSYCLDAHLMISRPDRYLEAFAQSGVDAVTIHVEADVDLHRTLATMAELGLKCGLSLNPATPLDTVRPFLQVLDLILVMSVQPGFGGQTFQEAALEKIVELKYIRESNNLRYAISVDGGVDGDTASECRKAGADILVSGTFLFKAPDRARAVDGLRGRV